MMQHLVKLWLRDEFLELQDGTTLYYCHALTGPGYVLKDDDRRIVEASFALMGWAIFTFFLVPNDLLASWLQTVTGDIFAANLAIFGLLLLLLYIFLKSADRRRMRFLDNLEKRDPAHWNDDLKVLAKTSETRAGANPLWILAALIIGGWTTGFILETALELWLMG